MCTTLIAHMLGPLVLFPNYVQSNLFYFTLLALFLNLISIPESDTYSLNIARHSFAAAIIEVVGTSFIVVAGGITNANEVTNTVEMIELRLEDHEDHGKDDHYWKTGKKDHVKEIVNPFFSFKNSKRGSGSQSNLGK